ncbi:MAG: hypothetical protein U0354_06450 [Candidatus Sericytochromatia bacterium]
MNLNIKAIPLLIIAILSLFLGVWGGLLRIGWILPVINLHLIPLHGAIMVCGFLGTLICIERAVAVNKIWAYISPLFSVIGIITLILINNLFLAKSFILLSSISLLAIFLYLLNKEKTINIFIMLVGVLSWITGNLLWMLNYNIFQIVFWWILFLLLTISGERLELARLTNLGKDSKSYFIFTCLTSVIGLLITLINFDYGIKIFGLANIFFSIWLIRFDIAKRTIKSKGLTKFIASCLLSGYFWLCINGLIALYSGENLIENYYDPFLHSFFLGFIFSMIFGHAPIIFPAVLKTQIIFSNRFYIHLVFLHLSLFLRILSKIFELNYLLKISTLLNAIALLIFLINTITSIKLNKNTINKKLETNTI